MSVFSPSLAIIGATSLAQSSATDRASRNITLVIVGLLLIALTLAALTAWYWRKTDPRRRLAAAQVRPASGSPSERAAAPASHSAMVRSGTASAGTSSGTASARAAGVSTVDDHDASFWAPANAASTTSGAGVSSPPVDEDDEWLSLTGPQSLPRPEPRSNGSDPH